MKLKSTVKAPALLCLQAPPFHPLTLLAPCCREAPIPHPLPPTFSLCDTCPTERPKSVLTLKDLKAHGIDCASIDRHDLKEERGHGQ